MIVIDKKYADVVDKIDKYIAKFADRVEFSATSRSRYYSMSGRIIRISDHIGNTSDGMYHIIVKPNGYLIHHPNSGTVNIVSYEQVKEFVRVFMLFPVPCGPALPMKNISEPLVSDEENINLTEKNNYILGVHKKHLTEGQLDAIQTILKKIIHSKRGE